MKMYGPDPEAEDLVSKALASDAREREPRASYVPKEGIWTREERGTWLRRGKGIGLNETALAVETVAALLGALRDVTDTDHFCEHDATCMDRYSAMTKSGDPGPTCERFHKAYALIAEVEK